MDVVRPDATIQVKGLGRLMKKVLKDPKLPYPKCLEAHSNSPRPVRDWGGEEWGRKDLTEAEKKKVEEDDIMMWRAIMVMLVATHVRRAQQPEMEDPRFLVEQPVSRGRFLVED